MELHAPSRWRCVDFISDLHLQADAPATFEACKRYLERTPADAVFILGDLFEVWVGDDMLAQERSFEQECVAALRALADRADLYIMHGNRDFLMGPALMQACQSTLLDDPTTLVFGAQRWLLTHGDALCVDDTNYMRFRTLVRSPRWQQEFLEKTLPQRLELVRQIRQHSDTRKRGGVFYADVDGPAALASLQAARADHLVHGHTHRPDSHPLGDAAAGNTRIVLSDWDLDAQPPRAQVLRLSLQAPGAAPPVTIQRLCPEDAV